MAQLDNEVLQARLWTGDQLPLSSWTKFRSRYFHEVHDHLNETMCSHQLAVEGRSVSLNFRHNRAALRRVAFNGLEFGNPEGRIHVEIPTNPEACLVQFSLAGTTRITQNKECFDLKPGHLSVMGCSDAVNQVFEDGYRHFTVRLFRSDLEDILAGEVCHKFRPLEFTSRPIPLTGAAAAFAGLVRTICDDLDRGLDVYENPRAVEYIEDSMMRLLLAAVPNNYSDHLNADRSTAAPYYVRRVEEYIRHHADEAISLSQLVAISGVSIRSLNSGFTRFRDATPMRYLKNYRLDLARELLLGNQGRDYSVSEAAKAAGFTHMSKFAQSYLARFGQHPSGTSKKSFES